MQCLFQGNNLLWVNLIWPDAYQITVGDKSCKYVKITETEISCLPPKSEPFDALSDNARVIVSGSSLPLFHSLTIHDQATSWSSVPVLVKC